LHCIAIFNGRCEGDLEGKYTLHSYNGGLSTVDYFLGSAALLAQVVKLEVLDKRPESDHCPVLLQVKIKHSPIPSRTCSVRLTQLPKLHYDKERAPEFVESLGVEIESLGSCMDPVSYLANIQTVIKNAAKRVFGFKKNPVSCRNTFPRSPWFDQECKDMRKGLTAAVNNPETLLAKTLEREYARLIKRKKREFAKMQGTKMCELAKQNPATF
jgi:hypothetical protein